MKKLANSVSEMSNEMSVDQMRLYQAYVTKTLEAKEAEEAFFAAANLEEEDDTHVTDAIREVRMILQDQSLRLSGSECVLLASYNEFLLGEEHYDTKRLNTYLGSFSRKPSNTTKIVDILAKKSLMHIESDGLHSHKVYHLTLTGEKQVRLLLEQLNDAAGRDRLAVVD